MPQFKLSVEAKADLKKIAKYTEYSWGKEQRNHYLLQFDRCFHQIADNKEIGRACDHIRPGYRQHLQGSHLIFYRLGSDDGIEIIRILHKSMDVLSKRI